MIPTGKRITEATGVMRSDVLPTVTASQIHQFRFMHHRNGFEFRRSLVDDKSKWMPIIKPFVMSPGVNGIRAGRGGALVPMAKLQSNGWQFVPLDAPIIRTDEEGELVEEIGYLQTFDTKNPKRPCYAEVWHHPHIVGEGQDAEVDWHTYYDRKGLDATLELWMKEGIIQPPNEANVSKRVRLQRKRTKRAIQADAKVSTPVTNGKRQIEESNLTQMEAATKALKRPSKARKAAPKTKPASARKALLDKLAEEG